MAGYPSPPSDDTVGLAAVSSRLLELVSDRVGVILSLSALPRGADEPCPPFVYHATLSNFDFHKADKALRSAAGKGRTRKEAALGAIGEAIEHYCAFHVDPRQISIAPWSEVAAAAISPEECVLYSKRQYSRRDFPWQPWEPQAKLSWISAIELPSNRPVLCPAGLVTMVTPSQRREDALCPATSNGLAAGPDLSAAILGGLLELIERDAFLITWLNRLPAPEVVFSDDAGLQSEIRAHYGRLGIRVHVYRMHTDLPVYIMMAVALDESGRGPAAVVGLGCNGDPEAALLKALFELCQVHPAEVGRFRSESPGARLQRFEDVHSLDDHSQFFALLQHLPEMSFLIGGGRHEALDQLPCIIAPTPEAELERCVDALCAGGHRVAYAELTTPDIRDYGLHVVRTLATGLQPMHFGYGLERLGGRRLYELPARLGLTAGIRVEEDLNPCPHPLA